MGLKKKEKLFSSLENREEKEKLFLRFLKIERRTRHENQLLASEREKSESFLFENFSRSRLLSMSNLVLGWVTACYRCLDSTCSALTQLLQTACEVTNGQISRSELNGTISAGGTRAVMHSIQPHGIDPIIPSCHLLPKREVYPNHTTLTD